MSQIYSPIPSCRALVPVCDVRRAALDAIAEVEDKRRDGKRLSGQPFARAFFRHLSGEGRASGRSLMQAGVMWEPRNRMTSISDYEYAFNVLLQSQGLHCPLPLSGSVRQRLFPEYSFSQANRRDKKGDIARQTAARREARKEARKYLLLQGLVGQAAVELNFCTPVTALAWYARWEREFPEEMIEGAFWRWVKRFPSLRPLRSQEGMGIPLWSVMADLAETNDRTPGWLHALERWMVPNKLLNKGLE